MSYMSPSKNYLGAAIPEVKKESPRQSGNEYDAQIAGLQAQIADLVDQMKKQSRDDQDAQYNVGTDNLDENLLKIINGLQSQLKSLDERVTALEGN